MSTGGAQLEAAHTQLQRVAAVAAVDVMVRRAKNRRREIKALMRGLDRIPDVCTSDVPCREERERLIGPVLKDLEKATKHARALRPPRTNIPTTKEIPMPESSGEHGRVIEGPREEPLPRTNGHGVRNPANLPLDSLNEVEHWERQFAAPNFSAVRSQTSARLARVLLDRPPAAQQDLLARVFYHLGLQVAGRR